MNEAELLTIIGFVVSASLGAVGWIFAGVANRRAKEAVEKADHANRIAEDANKLSEEANKLVGRSVAAQTEDWFVDWRVEWNYASASVVLKNRGDKAALQASAIIVGEGVYKREEWPNDVAPNTDEVIQIPQIIEQRTAKASRNVQVVENMSASGFSFAPRSFRLELSISIRWRTGEGFPRDKDLNLVVF